MKRKDYMAVLLSRRIINKSFCATANIQLPKFRFNEGLNPLKMSPTSWFVLFTVNCVRLYFGLLVCLSKYTQIAVWVPRFHTTSFNQVWSSYVIVPRSFLLSDGDTEHLMVRETSFSKGAIIDMQMLLKVKMLFWYW